MGFYQKMAEDRKAGLLGKPKYRVLQVDMMKQTDREKAATVLSFVQSDADAVKLAGQDGFAYRDLDLRRRVGVVTYKGIEIALLFKREITELEPGPADPVPQNIISDPVGVWLQIDLLSADPVEKRKGLGDRLGKAMGQVSNLQVLWTEEKGRRERAEELNEKLQKENDVLRPLREELALMRKEKKFMVEEAEALRRDLKKAVEDRKADKVNLVRQMFPVFDTVWLAGLHRVGDKLYSIIKQQMLEGLEKIGVKLLAPAVGDAFDPALHNAVHAHPFPRGSKEVGTVTQLLRTGWQVGSATTAADVSVGVEKKEDTDGETGSGSAKENSVGPSEGTVPGSSTEVGPVGLQSDSPVVAG